MIEHEFPVPASPLDIIGRVTSEVSPWFGSIVPQKYRGRPGVGIVCSNPHGGLGYVDEPNEPVYARFLSFRKIHKAFLGSQSDLCCASDMLKGGYRMACARDADIIMQHAVYLDRVWE